MTLAGLVSHMRWVENLWFEIVYLGRPAEGPQFEGPEDADMMVDRRHERTRRVPRCRPIIRA